MAGDDLAEYRRRRDARRTPEPVPARGPLPRGDDDTFVIQEHHATALHWDFRLERDGVLVSWAVPKGLPVRPRTNHLAVHTEDHPLEYASFAGEIPAGEYGGGQVIIWDRGRYETEKWTDDEVKVVLHGTRASGRYVLIRTGGKNWIMRRMDRAAGGVTPPPATIRPMMATLRERLPADEGDGDDADWAYEMKWDGVRAVVYVEGGRARALSRNDLDVTASWPELRAMAASLGARQVVLDGEIVAFDAHGRPSFSRLQQRMHVTAPAAVRRLAGDIPATYMAFDVLHLDGRSTLELGYQRRRELLESLHLDGPNWLTPPVWYGGGAAVLSASAERGFEGVVAKRRDSPYQPGRRGTTWVKVKHLRTQEVLIGGWRPGKGRRAGMIGSLLLGVRDEEGRLAYAGHVGTGFTTASLRDLGERLRPLRRDDPPFDTPVPRAHARDARWVEPVTVGEVRFGEWTRDGLLRQPAWRGLRPDKDPDDVRRSAG